MVESTVTQKSQSSQPKGSSNSLADKFDSNLYLGNSKNSASGVGSMPTETKGSQGTADQERKNSTKDSSASAKVSDGASSIAKQVEVPKLVIEQIFLRVVRAASVGEHRN